MFARWITNLNLLKNRLHDRGGIVARLIDVLTDYCWIRTVFFWEFDLTASGFSQGRKKDEDIDWSLASSEDCRRWSGCGADGFEKEDCELLTELVKRGDRLVVGRLADSGEIPACYAVCAFGRKSMTRKYAFENGPKEGTIRTVYTRRDFRGRGLATRLYSEHCRIARESGLERLFVDIESSNVASYRAAEKAGAVRIATSTIYLFRFFKCSYIVAAGPLRTRIVRCDDEK